MSPWRISYSHDLSNLLSLCKKCHKKEDQKLKKLYGLKDVLVGRQIAEKRYCPKCNGVLSGKTKQHRMCHIRYTAELVDKYIDSELSLRAIGELTGLNYETIRRHLKKRIKLLAV